jgi:hypothetical protein
VLWVRYIIHDQALSRVHGIGTSILYAGLSVFLVIVGLEQTTSVLPVLIICTHI